MATKATKATSTTRAKGGAETADYDAIIVGGGHNGLVAAAYLARSGARTLVLEARNKTGGAATTEAPWPDAPEFNVTRLSYVMSLLPPTIIKDLQLERHGYKIFPIRTIADVTRLMTMSIADLLDDWFESPQVKGALAVNGVIGTWAGPYEPGTAYVMAHHSIGDVGTGTWATGASRRAAWAPWPTPSRQRPARTARK
jgi:phytoene dehydrogenase-like protein